jgi:hypothetical protein
MLFKLLTALSIACSPAAVLQEVASDGRIPITDQMWHLGDDVTPEWPEAPEAPQAAPLEIRFEGQAFEGEGLLFLTQRSIDNEWTLELNGAAIATLARGAELIERAYELPAGLVRDGENTLTLSCDRTTDDITIGKLRYYPFGLRTLHDLRPAAISVRDDQGLPLPARVTITDLDGSLVPIYYAERSLTAVREGVVYTADGLAQVELPAGQYRVWAARGTEWSIASAELDTTAPEAVAALVLRRELDTTGFVAADTHIHTLTHSGHGDSSVEERMVTLAGEGVELAIATDHNHNTDYVPTQLELGLGAYFTPAVGNEVTTPIGHFNAFPLRPEDEVPPHDLEDVVKIVDGIRARGAKAVILNHPRWPDHESGPHGKIALDHDSGDWVGTWACPFDAVELINSQTEEHEPMLLFRDWFALLNRGERVFAVGSSDSHTVGGVVGQGRTYVLSSTDDPARISIEEAAHNIAHGHSSISMGILVQVSAEGRPVMGETIRPQTLMVRVSAPSWVRPTKLTIYANGEPVHQQELAAEPGPMDLSLTLPEDLPLPEHDYWLVALVQGDGVGGAWWPQMNDYTLAATNPVFIDRDGDGRYDDPQSLARRLLERMSDPRAELASALEGVDAAVAVQLLKLARLDAQERLERELLKVADGARERHPRLGDWLRREQHR